MIPILTAKHDDPDPWVRVGILDALRIIGSMNADAIFVKHIHDMDGNARVHAIQGIIQIKSDKENDAIARIMKDVPDDESFRYHGLDCFGKTRYHDGLVLVEQNVHHHATPLRCIAIRALGRIGETTKVDDLIFFADDIEGSVREAAAIALARLNKGKWLPLLKEVLDGKLSDIYGCSEVVLRHAAPEVFKKLSTTSLTLTGELKEVKDIVPILEKATGIPFRSIGVDDRKMRLPLCLFERPFTVLEILECIDANSDGHVAFVHRDGKIDILAGDTAFSAFREAVKSILEK